MEQQRKNLRSEKFLLDWRNEAEDRPYRSRRFGSSLSDRLKRNQAAELRRRALVTGIPAPGLVHHTDRGSKYCLVYNRKPLRKRGMLIFMREREYCYFCSMLETFFETSKSELIRPVALQTRQQAEDTAAIFIQGLKNQPSNNHQSAPRVPSPSSDTPKT